MKLIFYVDVFPDTQYEVYGPTDILPYKDERTTRYLVETEVTDPRQIDSIKPATAKEVS